MSDTPPRRLRVLILEDDPPDAELMVVELKRAGFDPVWQRVDNEIEYVAALQAEHDVILSDFNMPEFDAIRALDVLRGRGLATPFIIVSGSIGEETAVQAMRSGAADYLLKDRLARLGQAVQRAVDERRLQQAKNRADDALGIAEERMRFALQASRVGIWEVDAATGLVRWSEILEALHGLAPGTFEGTFAAFIGCVHPEDRQRVTDATATQRNDLPIVYRAQWPDGSVHWISQIGRSLIEGDGTSPRAAGISIDVTEYRALEDQYRQSQKMEAFGQLAGGIAHDFNNLLTAIQGFATLLSEDLGAGSPHQADLDQILRAAARAASLTRQLLSFSRRQMVEPRTLDLREALASMNAMLKRLIGEDIEIDVASGPDLWLVTADPGQIEQVLLNLVLNARDAMPRGGKLLIELVNVELDDSFAVRKNTGCAPGPYLMLAVSDTGVGMTAAVRERIFEPFFTTKEIGKGTGLGLSTVYGIVKQSHGHIDVYSEPGRGTTFKVYLPRAAGPTAVGPESGTPIPLAGSEVVLVVEDEEALRELVQKCLERHGYHVIAAATPDQALVASDCRDGVIHLLLSDVVLPQMSGTMLAEQIRRSRPGIRVLYMSGYTEKGIVHGGVLGAQIPFIEKPFTLDHLLRKIREGLDSPRF
jgi:two-component system cell cycle sensor histidine kinase/response regulator CckA